MSDCSFKIIYFTIFLFKYICWCRCAHINSCSCIVMFHLYQKTICESRFTFISCHNVCNRCCCWYLFHVFWMFSCAVSLFLVTDFIKIYSWNSLDAIVNKSRTFHLLPAFIWWLSIHILMCKRIIMHILYIIVLLWYNYVWNDFGGDTHHVFARLPWNVVQISINDRLQYGTHTALILHWFD